MCTEAVETLIGKHYQDQYDRLLRIETEGFPIDPTLKDVIKHFRDEELEHLDCARKNDAQSAPMHALLTFFIQFGCKVAIMISERI
jgi:ubiquinone biosynthesis monooxygenase Coq7